MSRRPDKPDAAPMRVHLTNMPELDTLVALEYGRVDEGTPEEWWRRVGADVAYLHDPHVACDLGFKVREFSRLDVDALSEIWRPPHFAVPMLALADASAGEIILAARALLGNRPTISHQFFALAAEASGEEALNLWLCCLEAGDSVAHWGVGATLLTLGRFHEAYRHLRYYTEISSELSWSWCWYGRAAEALGLDAEALAAYRKAVALEERDGDETGAAKWLEDLEARLARRPRQRRARRRPRWR
jgi:tetratricopeptide (TPR) repeat protein